MLKKIIPGSNFNQKEILFGGISNNLPYALCKGFDKSFNLLCLIFVHLFYQSV